MGVSDEKHSRREAAFMQIYIQSILFENFFSLPR